MLPPWLLIEIQTSLLALDTGFYQTCVQVEQNLVRGAEQACLSLLVFFWLFFFIL